MFRIMQASVVLAVTLIIVNQTEANGNSSPLPKHPQANTIGIGNDKNFLPVTFTPPKGHGPVVPPSTTKNPVHGIGSSHVIRSPINTHGRDFCNWSHRFWNSQYGCETCWSDVDGCYFYFYAPANCYYPVSCIDHFPPVRQPSQPVSMGPRHIVPLVHSDPVRRTPVQGR